MLLYLTFSVWWFFLPSLKIVKFRPPVEDPRVYVRKRIDQWWDCACPDLLSRIICSALMESEFISICCLCFMHIGSAAGLL